MNKSLRVGGKHDPIEGLLMRGKVGKAIVCRIRNRYLALDAAAFKSDDNVFPAVRRRPLNALRFSRRNRCMCRKRGNGAK